MSPSPTVAAASRPSAFPWALPPSPVAASSAIAPLLRGSVQTLRVLAVFPQALYVTVGDEMVGDDVIAIVTSDGIRHPNAVVLSSRSSTRPLARLYRGQPGEIGLGGLRVGHLRLRVARWWDPRPRLRPCTPSVLVTAADHSSARMAAVTQVLPTEFAALLVGVSQALAVDDHPAAVSSADRLLGLGPGLTPSGDDLLAGLVAGTSVLAPSVAAVGRTAATTLRDAAQRLGRWLAAAAPGRTTSVSAALLSHAAHGRLAEPAADLVRAWTGGADVRTIVAATDRLLAVGSSSGTDLAAGLLAAVRLVTSTPLPVTSSAAPGPVRRIH